MTSVDEMGEGAALAGVVRCPECDTSVDFDRAPLICEIVTCARCDAELEVVGLEPTVLALAPEVEEDWGE